METEKQLLQRNRESGPVGRESREQKESRESKENKESELDPEARALAVLERADIIVKEVKTSKKQMQNIFVNMQQVKATIKQLRALLQLQDDDNDDHHSAEQDKKRIQELRKKITLHQTELENMRHDLVCYQKEELEKQNLGLSAQALQEKAEKMVEQMIASVRE